MKQSPEDALALLQQYWDLLLRSMQTLQQSKRKVQILLDTPKEYTFEDLESFDSLTSKFSRSSDVYLQKVIRSVWILLREETLPLIDVLNRAEKIFLILSAEDLLQMRDVRNQIAHEYLPEAIPELASEVIFLTEKLEQNVQQTKRFLEMREWISPSSKIEEQEHFVLR
jgi:hypothetical protein